MDSDQAGSNENILLVTQHDRVTDAPADDPWIDDVIAQWTLQHHVILQKIAEESWGTYQLGMSFDGVNVLGFARRFGFGWTLIHALAFIHQDLKTANARDEQLVGFFGSARYDEFIALAGVPL